MVVASPSPLLDLMRRRNLEVADVAQACGVTRSSVYHWLNGIRSPRYRHVVALSRALKRPVRDILKVVPWKS